MNIPLINREVRRLRLKGHTYEEIGEKVGICRSTVQRICKREGIPAPAVNRAGRWRLGKKGATPAQLVAHSKPENLVNVLVKYGYLPHLREAMRLESTAAKKIHWQSSDPNVRSA